jgi:ABC-type phosphate transport system permease subunit
MNVSTPATPSDLIPTKGNTLSSHLTGARLKDFLFGRFILLNAVLAISILFLIFIYVGKEAIPIFTTGDPERGRLDNMFAPQSTARSETFVFCLAAVSKSLNMAFFLFPGDLKVTLSLLFGAPLAIAAALTAEFAASSTRNCQARRRVAGRNPFRGPGVPGAPGFGHLAPGSVWL